MNPEKQENQEGQRHDSNDSVPFEPNVEVGPPQKQGVNITQIIVGAIVSIIIAWGIVSLIGVPKTTYRDDFTRLETDIVAVRSDTGELSTQLATYAKKADLDNLSSQLSNYVPRAEVAALVDIPNTIKSEVAQKFVDYEARIAAMEATLAQLNLVDEGGDVVISEEDTRWSFGTPEINCSDSNMLCLDLDYDRIEEEGLYEIELTIENISSTPADLSDVELILVLQPREYVPINEDDTYLDSDDTPWLSWDNDFVIKTREEQEVCRRITFTSDYDSIITVLEPGNSVHLDLVLELYYK